MATITYIGGTTSASGAYGIRTLTYTPTTGNYIVVTTYGLSSEGNIVEDNNGNELTLLATSPVSGDVVMYIFGGIAIAGATSYSCLVDGYTACLAEYSGSSQIFPAQTTTLETGSATSASLTISILYPNDFVVAGFSTSAAPTATTGNLREIAGPTGTPTSGLYQALLDNTSATAGTNVTDAISFASSTVYGVALELTVVTYPTVTTSAATNVFASTAILNGSVTVIGGVNPTSEGFVYSTTNFTPVNGVAPSTYGTVITLNGPFGVNSFSKEVVGLTAPTTYYYAAWADNLAGYGYGSVQSFTTSVAPNVGSVFGYGWGMG